jgi:pyruvate,water dikinase
MKIVVVDLGNGLRQGRGSSHAELEDVTSIPFQALLRGMKHEQVNWSRDVGISWGGFASIVAQTAIRDPMTEGRMGAPSYAVIAGHYLNFNSRLGFHFTTIDTYCGPKVNDNYITFYFKGGAADIGRRSRRALMIAQILKQLGFKVELKGDMVRGEIKKYEENFLVEKLDQLGRLLGAVRLLDMHLADDRQVDWYVEQFMHGNYQFETDHASASTA